MDRTSTTGLVRQPQTQALPLELNIISVLGPGTAPANYGALPMQARMRPLTAHLQYRQALLQHQRLVLLAP